MGQHELGRAVTDGVNARDAGAHEVVDLDGAAFGELDAGGLQAVPLDPRGEADGLQDSVGLEHGGLATLGRTHRDLDLVSRVVDRLDLGAGHDLDAELLVGPGEFLGDLGILVGDHPVKVLDDGDLGAVVGQDVGELGADGARTSDDDRSGDLVGEDLLLVGDDAVRQLGSRQGLDGGPSGDDAVVEGDLVGHLTLPVLDDDGLGPGELAPPGKLGDLVLLHEVVDTLDHPVGHLTRPAVGLAEVDGDVAADAEGASLLCGGDAANVEADTTPIFLLDDGGLLAELSGTNGGNVAARASSEDNNVKM